MSQGDSSTFVVTLMQWDSLGDTPLHIIQNENEQNYSCGTSKCTPININKDAQHNPSKKRSLTSTPYLTEVDM